MGETRPQNLGWTAWSEFDPTRFMQTHTRKFDAGADSGRRVR